MMFVLYWTALYLKVDKCKKVLKKSLFQVLGLRSHVFLAVCAYTTCFLYIQLKVRNRTNNHHQLRESLL